MMDEKMKKEIFDELEKLGVAKDQVDEYMVWGIKKLMLGVMKIKWSLNENGIKGKEAEETLKKIAGKVVAMDADELHQMMQRTKAVAIGTKRNKKLVRTNKKSAFPSTCSFLYYK